MSYDSTEKDLIQKLVVAWPKAFFINQDARRPLKIGVHRDMAGHAHGFSDAELRRAVSQYCRSPGYLAACVEGAVRIGLDGEVAGEVSVEAVAAAVKAVRLSQEMRREQRETKMEEKAGVAAAAASEQQMEKALTKAAPERLSLADLRVAARRRQEATMQRVGVHSAKS